MKVLFILLLLCIVTLASFEPFAHKPCTQHDIMRNYFNDNPGLEEEHNALREQMKQVANSYLQHNTKQVLNLVQIPVVWHILHDDSNSDTLISEEAINNEMMWLNQWFSASNTHYDSGSSYWSNDIAIASDFQIEFVLASVDPNGNPTSGINYKETSTAITCGDYAIFRSEEGGIDAWNTLEYMNVYTCAITHAAGYAYLPSSGTHERDAMVLASEYVGSSYISGSIFAHEMGHWLGLQHTFESCAAPGDNIDDTPPSDEAALYWVDGGAACPGDGGMTDADFQRCGGIIQIQNCMDYNYEHCKSFFSKGQVAVMRSWLDTGSTVRGGLKDSPGLGTGSGGGGCTPDCSSSVCGDDGCGGSCGSCNSGSQCVSGACVVDEETPSPSSTVTPTPSRSIPTITDEIQAFRDTIVSEHNTLRSSVDPEPQVPLTPYSYSVSLEAEADSFTSACSYSFPTTSHGVNLYATTSTSSSQTIIQSAINSWAEPKPDYHLTATSETCNVGSCGTYKQIIWDSTSEVACSVQHCTQNSPFGSGAWSLGMCYYASAGNIIGQLPYDVCTDCTDTQSCQSVCPDDVCGEFTTDCGEVLNCGCCDDPCVNNFCGNHQNACGESINCGSCTEGSSCSVQNGSYTCVLDPVCDHQTECAQSGVECNFFVFCEVNEVCGFCSDGEICENYQCVPDPCLGCPVNSACDDNNECQCLTGYVLDDLNNCILPSSGGSGTPDYSNIFSQTLPDGPSDFTIPDIHINLATTGDHILNWDNSENVVDVFTTNSEITVDLTAGEFGFNIRYGQSAGGRTHDRIMWHVKDIGSNPALSICLVYYGTDYCGSYYSIDFPSSPTVVKVSMTHDGGSNIITTFKAGSGSTWSSYIWDGYYPDIGSISYFISPTSGTAVFSEAILATSTTLTVSLTDCIDDSEWEQMFYDITGADPSTTSVDMRDGDNADCSNKKSATGKILISGFTSVVTSASVPASALASKLAASVGGPLSAGFGISTVTPIPGVTGASIAGFPTSIAALGGSIVQTPGIASGAGAATAVGGGAAAGGSAGLSGGEIAGIVVGSVAGAALLAGVAGLVVVGVIIGALILTDDGSDDDAPSDDRRRSVRRTIRGFFGGVDVMNNPENKGHQSITARSPAM